jgi:Ulp1 family protease
MRSHFVLIVVNRKKKTIQFIDSILSSKPTNTDYMKFYKKMFNHFEVNAKLEPTAFHLLKTKTSQQNNCYDRGVFVCMFAYMTFW